MTITKEIKDKAFQMGVNQFKAGKSHAPGLCQEFNDWLLGMNLPIEEGGLEILKSFARGWHRACDEHFLPEMFEELVTI